MKRSQVALTTEIASITKSRKLLHTRVFLTKRGIMIDLPALIKDPLTNLLRSVNSGEHEHDCTALSSMTPLDDSSWSRLSDHETLAKIAKFYLFKVALMAFKLGQQITSSALGVLQCLSAGGMEYIKMHQTANRRYWCSLATGQGRTGTASHQLKSRCLLPPFSVDDYLASQCLILLALRHTSTYSHTSYQFTM